MAAEDYFDNYIEDDYGKGENMAAEDYLPYDYYPPDDYCGEIPKCPYCGGEAELVPDTAVYVGGYGGMLYVCENYPKCDSYVGAHKETDEPLGTLANQELRTARSHCHSQFDLLWKGKGKKISRGRAYEWLAEALDIDEEECHIAKFDLETCHKATQLCFIKGME